jgi:hypothetical protein
LVSCYFQATKRDMAYQGTLSEFIRDPQYGIQTYLHFLSSWQGDKSRNAATFHVISYTDMYYDTARKLAEVLNILGCKHISEHSLRDALEYTRFDNMRKLERTGYFRSKRLQPANPMDVESYKVRRGIVGGYKDYLTEEDCAYIESAIQQSACPFIERYATPASHIKHVNKL